MSKPGVWNCQLIRVLIRLKRKKIRRGNSPGYNLFFRLDIVYLYSSSGVGFDQLRKPSNPSARMFSALTLFANSSKRIFDILMQLPSLKWNTYLIVVGVEWKLSSLVDVIVSPFLRMSTLCPVILTHPVLFILFVIATICTSFSCLRIMLASRLPEC